jgi:tripartite-type tricarboxylate transporter receptor subunit TctC
VAPAGTPIEVVARLNAVINEGIRSPDVSATLAKLAVDAKNETSGQFGAFLASELGRLSIVVKALNLQAE